MWSSSALLLLGLAPLQSAQGSSALGLLRKLDFRGVALQSAQVSLNNRKTFSLGKIKWMSSLSKEPQNFQLQVFRRYIGYHDDPKLTLAQLYLLLALLLSRYWRYL